MYFPAGNGYCFAPPAVPTTCLKYTYLVLLIVGRLLLGDLWFCSNPILTVLKF